MKKDTKNKSFLFLMPGILCIVASLVLSFFYFSQKNTFKETMKQFKMFYPKIKPGWFFLSESELKSKINSGNMNEWDNMVIRAALNRWRIRNIATETFDNIMNDYQKGLWKVPKKNVWEETFQDFDNTWLKNRNKFLINNNKFIFDDSNTTINKINSRFEIKFSDRPLTAQIGSVIRLVVETDSKYFPRESPRILWATNKISMYTSHHRRLGLLISEETISDNFIKFKIEADMSWEPDWMADGVRLISLQYTSSGAENWKIIKIEFDDSPLLKNISDK